ncbi:hypothetical protein [Rudaea cellulosilytica]|uniref:hypothetical protein n=1 Tax=Rudaea cellulosilytica TaxID=540746 RepID=UPI000373F2D5|nr:hypothetical protein [Rudaea cellulosilytica]
MAGSVPHADATPLTERLADALAYPSQPGPLSTLAAIAASHVVADWLPSLPGMLIDFVTWAAFLKYAFEALRWSANGRDTAPELSFLVGESAGWFGVGVLVIGQLAVIGAARFYGPGAGYVVGAVVVLAMPAIMMLIAVEDATLLALNPVSWLRIAARLGTAYFALVVFFALAVAAQVALAVALGVVLPRFIAIFAVHFASGWLLLANFRLIGMLIHDRRDELGYAGDLTLRDDPQPTDPVDAVIASAQLRAAAGDASGAAALLLDELRSRPKSIALHLEYRRRLREAGDTATLAAHGRGFVPVLLDLDQDRLAIDVARESQQCNADFVLDEPADITRLAAAAANTAQTQVALSLLDGFHLRFPAHADVVRNLLLAAKLLAERMNDDAGARALLQHVAREFPDHPQAAEAQRYLDFLDRLGAADPRAAKATASRS